MAHQYQYQQYQEQQQQQKHQQKQHHYHYHHDGPSQPQQFVAELEAHNPGAPMNIAGNAQPIFEMSGESAVTVAPAKSEQPRPVSVPDTPVQAHPWPFYLDDARHSQNPTAPKPSPNQGQMSDGPGPSMNAESSQANPWPYHGPMGEEKDHKAGSIVGAARTDNAAPLRDNSQPHPHPGPVLGAEAEPSASAAATANETPPADNTGTGLDVTGRSESRPGSTSPSKLYPAPLRLSRTPQPPSPVFKAYSPRLAEQDQSSAAPAASPPHPRDTATMPYRPYRPSSASPPGGRPGTGTASHGTEQIAAKPPVAPYPLDDDPSHFPQLPQPQTGPSQDPARQSSSPLAAPVARRSTQPSAIAADPLMSYPDPSLHRHHSLSTPSATQPPQSVNTTSSFASPTAITQTGSLHHRPPSSTGTHYGRLPSPHAVPAHHPLPYTGITQETTSAFTPPVVQSPPPMHHPQSPGTYPPSSPATAATRPHGLPHTPPVGQMQNSPPSSHVHQQSQSAPKPAGHLQTQDAVLPQAPPRPAPEDADAGPRPSSQQYAHYQQQLSPSPPPPPPRPYIQHVTTDPISPTYVQTQSTPPAHVSGVLRTNSQPAPVAHASSHYPPPQSPAPHDPYHPPPPTMYSPAPQGSYSPAPQGPYSPVPQGPYFAQPQPQPQPPSPYHQPNPQNQPPFTHGPSQPQVQPHPPYSPPQPYSSQQQQHPASHQPPYSPQLQYPASYQPPLPPRPTTGVGYSGPVGFGPKVPNAANFPPPPKTQYAPGPQGGQKPSSTMKLFSGSSAKKWLDKTNQVLESTLAPMLQGQTDPRPRPGVTQTPIYPFQPAPPSQNYYPYAIRGDPMNQGQQTGSRGPPGR